MSTVIIEQPGKGDSNKILVKGLITGLLILIMLIPTWFVNNLVKEREERQKQIVAEVSSKWAPAQKISGPYISVPYIETTPGADGKQYTSRTNLVLLPEQLNVNGKIVPQPKQRSIYKVMVYKSDISVNGMFNISLPDDLQPEKLDLTKARICVGISDYKGIEEAISVRFNNTTYNLLPGLPTNQVSDTGLSAPINITATDLGKPVSFNTILRIKGSNGLYFLPLSATSKYQLSSSWPSPSFDGATLPTAEVKDSGFDARWGFNQANLPFGTTVRDNSLRNANISFGLNLIQPADQYAKTMRSVKYAILFIGLTFALFFIVELMQQRPVHPVQYVLVGIALVIFYTLLLSISEFVAFDLAYIIAALATVSLITLYAKGHFQSWKVAAIFASVLGSLYAFIFVLIRLEDTALLVGSIGLFIVLALVMYFSRKVNWYAPQPNPSL
jgi:inner membrane protein